MASLPETGPISLGQLQTEFGGTNPVGISEYYKGGAEVPDTGVTNNVPTSGAISLSDFYGTQDTQFRDISFEVRYRFNSGFQAGRGLLVQSSTAAPSNLSHNSSTDYYQPVFRAGKNFITQLNINVGQNEDNASNVGHVILYGGTNSSNVTEVVFRWDASFNGNTGGSRSYQIDFADSGQLTGITYTGGSHNTGIITLAVQNINSDHRWFGFYGHAPDSGSGSKGAIMLGGLTGLTNVLQPD